MESASDNSDKFSNNLNIKLWELAKNVETSFFNLFLILSIVYNKFSFKLFIALYKLFVAVTKSKGNESNSFIARVESNISDKSLLAKILFMFSIFWLIISMKFRRGSFNFSYNCFASLFAPLNIEINLFNISFKLVWIWFIESSLYSSLLTLWIDLALGWPSKPISFFKFRSIDILDIVFVYIFSS